MALRKEFGKMKELFEIGIAKLQHQVYFCELMEVGGNADVV